MTREEFISELREKLSRLPKSELDDALNYYNELFLDAGADEELTAASLGPIDELARQIYVDNGIDPDGKAEFLMEEYIDPNKQYGQAERGGPLPIQQQGAPRYRQPKGININISKLLLAIVLFPLWFPILMVCLALTIVFVAVCFALEFVLIVVGVALIIGGIGTVSYVPPLGICYIGVGLILTGIFTLTAGRLVKGIFRGAVRCLNNIVNRAHNVLYGGAENG